MKCSPVIGSTDPFNSCSRRSNTQSCCWPLGVADQFYRWVKGWEAIEGNDVCGHVEAVGSKVTEFKKGDKVAAFSVMMKDTKYGA